VLGPNGIPVEQALELDRQAKALGVEPDYLLGIFIKIGLKKRASAWLRSGWRRLAKLHALV
jgi:hypothetical protein